MKFFSGLKARKLAKSIEKYPDVFRNYRDLIELHIQNGDMHDALETIGWAEQRTWDERDAAWLRVQKLNVESRGADDPGRILELALDVTADANVTPDLRMDAGKIAASLLLAHHRILTPEHIARAEALLPALAERMEDSEDASDLILQLAQWDAGQGRGKAALTRMKTVIDHAEKQRRKHIGTLYFKAARVAAGAGASMEEIRALNLRALESGDLTDEDTVDALVSVAAALRADDDLLGAMERYETALRFAGSGQSRAPAMVHFELARVYFELGRIPQAEKEVADALADPELTGNERAGVLLWIARSDRDRQRYAPAMERIEDALKVAESADLKIDILRLQADVQELQASFESAVATLESIESMLGDAVPGSILFQQARLHNLGGTHHKAQKILKNLRKDPAAAGDTGMDRILLETARASLGQQRAIPALEQFIEVLDEAEPGGACFREARKETLRLKKELESPEGIRKYRIDGSDRKQLAGLLARCPEEEDFFTRLKSGLKKTRSGLIGGIENILKGHAVIDEDALDEIEELMILSDLGVETTTRIVDGLRARLRRKELNDAGVVRDHIRREIEAVLTGHSGAVNADEGIAPYIIMVVGVNGVGKTTTIAKIARRFQTRGHSVLLAAGDTFRAGAIEQLKEWGRRLDIEVIAHDEGADPSAVAWDAVAAAKSRDTDILIIDTAGRLHTKSNLMEELRKVSRVIGKNMEGAPHEVLLVLDATTGQNAVMQAREFTQAVNISGIALTKLDGTAKGGIIVSIVQELDIPIKLIGIGERMDDLRDFDAEDFARALFETGENGDASPDDDGVNTTDD